MKAIKKQTLTFFSFAILAGFSDSVHAQILNGDFSANAPAYTANVGYNGGSNPLEPTGWTSGTGVNGVDTASTVFAPGAANYGPQTLEIFNPDGTDTGTSVRDFGFIQGLGSYTQTGFALAANTTYTLTLVVGQRGTYDNILGALSILDGTTALLDNVSLTVNTTHFVEDTLQLTTTSAGVGTIILSNNQTVGDSTADFSNVVLTAQSVPEPSSTLLGVLGMGALVVGAWSKRRSLIS